MSVISTQKDGEILVITSDSPPVNALGAVVREGLWAALDEFEADASAKAAVLICKGQTFFAGADISEFGTGMKDPDLRKLVLRIENLAKPLLAAVHGTALGGGCETAISCHYRIAVPSALLGVPEVKLGILPGAGGTQRLPRLIGVAATLEMVTSGNPIPATKAMELGLIDRLASEGSLLEAAVAFAREIADVRPIPRTGEKPAKGSQADVDAFRQANAKKFRGFEAPELNIQAVEGSLTLPLTEGLAHESGLFAKLAIGSQARAQQYMFFAQRQAAKIDGIAKDIPLRSVKKVGIIGAGTMGGGIAMNFLSVGIPVTIVEMKQEALDRGVGIIRKNYEASAAKGRFKPEQVEAAMNALTPSLDMNDLKDADLIIEAVFENIDVKKDVFSKLDKIAKPGAILASNTSFLNIDEIASATSRPQDVLGLHFFSPANVMKLLEVVRGAMTADDVLATAMALGKKIGKIAVVAGVCYGFIGNRILAPRQREAEKLLLEGATPAQIDKVHTDFGMPMGPFQMSDMAGVDVLWHRDPSRIDSIEDALNAENRWGQKKGAGWYDYDDKRNGSPSPRVQEIIEDFRAKKGVAPREITDEEIVERTLYPMVNEAALILEEKIAQRASDIDVVWVFGYGWPVYRGGPMFWANLEGLPKIVAGLEKHGFQIAKLLKDKAAAGENF